MSAAIHILAGGINLYVDEGPEQRVNVKKIISHEGYSNVDYRNDICLIEVNNFLLTFSN